MVNWCNNWLYKFFFPKYCPVNNESSNIVSVEGEIEPETYDPKEHDDGMVELGGGSKSRKRKTKKRKTKKRKIEKTKKKST